MTGGAPLRSRIVVTCSVETKWKDLLRPMLVIRNSSSVPVTFGALSTLYG
jgi:hypothetical protein